MGLYNTPRPGLIPGTLRPSHLFLNFVNRARHPYACTVTQPPEGAMPPPRLLDQVRDRLRVKHYSLRTAQFVSSAF